MVTISQSICTSKYHTVHPKYIHYLFVNHISIKLEKKKNKISSIGGIQETKAAVGGGGGGMNWEIGIDIYTLVCIKWMTNKNLLYKKNK